MAKDVFILGGAQTDFSRNLEREGGGLFELFRDVAEAAFAATGIEPKQVDTAHVIHDRRHRAGGVGIGVEVVVGQFAVSPVIGQLRPTHRVVRTGCGQLDELLLGISHCARGLVPVVRPGGR